MVSGSEQSGVMTLRGEWTIERESENLHLFVEIKKLEIEKRQDGSEVSERKVVASEDGRVPAGSIDGKYLEPDLESHALYAVRMLAKGIEERLSSRSTRYRVHMKSFAIEDVAQPEKLRRRLIRHLRPAFANSRELTRVHSAEMADGALHGEVSVFGESVELSLWIIDNQRKEEVAAVNVEMSKAEVVGSGVSARLAMCAAHFGADRLPEAAKCYQEVRKLDPGNAPAQAGLERIEERYVESARGAIRRGEFAEARGHVERLGALSPEHLRVPELEGEIAGAERKAEERRAAVEAEARRKREEEEARRKAEEERRRAEERRIAELTPEMVRIKGGCFQMGSPESETGRDDAERRHRVCVEAFSIGKTEVTRGQYAAFVRETGRAAGDACWTYESAGWEERSGRSWRSPGYGQEETHPVVCVSHEEAVAYASWLSGETGRRYRLPTEAEWEYAARGGTETSRYWGNAPSQACDYANVADHTLKEKYSDWEWAIHACRDGHVHTAPVGVYRANGYGLHDMLGNVWEWTCSEYDEGYGGAERRCASGGAGRRVLRGGSWSSEPWWVRSADRYGYGPDDRITTLGFRLAQD